MWKGPFARAAVLAAVFVMSACCRIPTYQPSFWNTGGTVQAMNNCYNYANNKRTDTFAQPGRASGSAVSTPSCQAVRDAAIKDKVLSANAAGDCPCGSSSCEDKIALVLRPGSAWSWDYHWYRRDDSGMWSHKPGSTRATNLDNSHNPISSPETANRGAYTEFCGYHCSCSNSVEGQGHEDIQ